MRIQPSIYEFHFGHANEETLFDYGARTDGQPVYIATAPTGTSQDAAAWLVTKYTYDGSNRATRGATLSNVVYTLRATYTF